MIWTELLIYSILFISLYFEVFLLITFFDTPTKRPTRTQNSDLENLPSVTIIVPCWNEESTISGTLTSLLNLEYPKDKLHIHIVDDGSTDDTYNTALQFTNDSRITLTKKENGGKHSAMNVALSQATTDLISCLDADSYVEPKALLHIVSHFSNPDIAAVTPGIKISNPNKILTKLQSAEYILLIFIRKAFSLLDSIFITPGPFSTIRTDVIRKIGPWKHAYGTEDMEMGIRLQKNFYKIENEPRAMIHTKAPTDIRDLYTQRVRWTYGMLRNSWEYRSMFFNYHYGNLGLLVLPVAILSIISVVVLTLFLIATLLHTLYEILERILITGLYIPSFQLDLFYINTSTASMIIYATLIITIILIVFGHRLSGDRKTFFSINTFWYLALYGIIAPIWVLSAVIKTTLNTGTPSWRRSNIKNVRF